MRAVQQNLVLVTAMLFLAGCATNIRSNRDAKLLGYSDPNTMAPVTAHIPKTNFGNQDSSDDNAKRIEGPVTLDSVIQTALSNSNIVRVIDGGQVDASQQTFYDVQASAANVAEALAEFDANITANIRASDLNSPPNAFFGPGLVQPLERDELEYGFGINRKLATGARTSIAYNPEPSYQFIPNAGGSGFNPSHVAELEFSLNQPLLKNSGLEYNVAPITISQIENHQSAWDFKNVMQESIRSVVEAYWELYSAKKKLESTKLVMPMLEEIVRIQKAAYEAKWVIEADVAKAEAELYGYRQEFISAQSDVVDAELRLRNLMGLPPDDGSDLDLVTKPVVHPLNFSPEEILDQAMLNNPDIARQRLECGLRKLELYVAENDLKPSLDLTALYRMNGIGEKLDDAISQMSTAEFADWEVGFSFSAPLGFRQAKANTFAAERALIKNQELLQQTALRVSYDLSNELRRLEFAMQELMEANKRLAAADKWLEGAQLRYKNVDPDDNSDSGLLEIINDYLRALRFRTDALILQADLTAKYNTAIIRLEESKGTLLPFFGISFPGDPCAQVKQLSGHEMGQEPKLGAPMNGKQNQESTPKTLGQQTSSQQMTAQPFAENSGRYPLHEQPKTIPSSPARNLRTNPRTVGPASLATEGYPL